MTFTAQEISSQDGRPVSFYKLEWGNTVWRYTSADRDLDLYEPDEGDTFTYTAVAISDDGVVQGGSANNDMTITVQSDIPLVDLYRSTPPVNSIWVTIRRKHFDDPDDEALVYWVGTVGNVKRPQGLATATVICRTLLASFKRGGLRLAWTRGCPHMLYDSECRANPAAFEVSAFVTNIADGVVTVSASGVPAAGWFDGGFISWDADGNGTTDRRGIEKSVNDFSFRLFGATDRLAIGMAVKLYPGCNLTAETCDVKFNNLANFGGFEQMTGKNPFDGTPIF